MIERYRDMYEHEKDCNEKMLAMIESVPEGARSDPKFQRTVFLAAHLAACRENWLDRMINGSKNQVPWWPEDFQLSDLRPRYAKLEAAWTDYLASLDDYKMTQEFEFPAGDKTFRWSVEGQIIQLVGHAFYHRGQIALLVSQLGGTPVDTDYLYWAFDKDTTWRKVGSR